MNLPKHPHHWYNMLLLLVLPILFLAVGGIVMANSFINITFLNNLCEENDTFICRYLSADTSGAAGNTVSQSGKTLKLTNNSGQNLFVPNKTRAELDAFLVQKDTLNVGVCETGMGKIANSSFGHGIKGCDDDSCVITENRGQKCVVKAGTTSWRIKDQKKWTDGSNFDWDGRRLSGRSDSRYLWRSKNNNDRIACDSDANNGKIALDPYGDGGWAEYKCKFDDSYCFWGWCGSEWNLARKINKPSSVREYEQQTITADGYGNSIYGSKCTEKFYTFRGSYDSQCYYDSDTGGEDTTRLLHYINPFTPTVFAQGAPIIGSDSGWYDCKKSCADYNSWSSSSPSVPAGCTSAGIRQTRIGVCYDGNNCGGQNTSSCTGYNSNCGLINDGSVSYNYTNSCVFDWKIDNNWGTCSGSGTQFRSVSCKDEQDHYASVDNCNSGSKPSNTRACDTYRWVNDDYYSRCTASCGPGGSLVPTHSAMPPNNPFAFILLSGVANAEEIYAQTTTISGTEYRKAKCYKFNNNVKTLVADSFCTGKNKYEPSRRCTRTCSSTLVPF